MSNRLTFSLASLIVLIAFGLVFVPVSVMAHDASQIGSLQKHDPHPTRALSAIDLNNDGDTTDVGEAAVSAHDVHPVLESITLKAITGRTIDKHPNMVVITADTDGDSTTPATGLGNNQFILVVDFDRDIGTGESALATTELSHSILNALKTASIDNEVEINSVTVDAEDASKFEVKVTIDADSNLSVTDDTDEAIPNGTKDDPLEKLYLQVRINANAVTGVGILGLDARPGSQNPLSAVSEFVLVKELPAEPVLSDTTPPKVTITAPAKANADGTLDFTIETDEAFGTGPSGLQATDFDIANGSAMETDLTEEAAENSYTLQVTPDDPMVPAGVTVALRANSVADVDGNSVVPTAAGPKATYDKISPTVLSHTSAKNTDLSTSQVNYLDITFTFSEAVKPLKVDVIDSGARTQNVEIVTTHFGPTQGASTDIWTITVKTVDPKARSSVRLKVGEDAVADLAGNTLGETYLASVPALVNSDPFFPKGATMTLPAGLCVGDSLNAVLPLAKDNEGDPLTYTLTKATVSVPNMTRTAGFYWETTDAQARLLKGIATLADGGTYTWTVMDSQGAMDSISFSIIVKALEKPEAVTGLTAEKVDSASEQAPTQNRVKLMWTAPTNKSAYPNCIPAVTSYTVTQTKLNELTGMFEEDRTYPLEDGTGLTSFTTPDKLPNGIYQFTITATNSAGNSPASELAVWKKTGGKRVIAADVPKWDSVKGADLRAAVDSDGNHVTVNWLKVPDSSDGDAPVYDDMVAATHVDDASQKAKRDKFYGSDVTGDFGGYVVYMINQATQNIIRYPADLPGTLGNPAGTLAISDYATTVSPYDHPTYRVGPLAPGQYVFRVTAMNIAGESARSVSTIDIITV